MSTLHEVRVVAELATKPINGADITKVVISLVVGKDEDVKIARAFSLKNVGAGSDEMKHSDIKSYVQDWKLYARKHKFIFRDDTDIRVPVEVKQ